MTNYKNRYKFTVEFWILENDDLEALRAAINYLEAGQVMEFRTAGYSFILWSSTIMDLFSLIALSICDHF